MAQVVVWPALWNLSHSRWLTDAALLSVNRFLDEQVITGTGLYRRDLVATTPGGSR
jgi:NTE family protein